MLSTEAYARRWGNLSVSLGSLMRYMTVLCFFTIEGRSGEDFKCSAILKRYCVNASQSCELTLEPKTEPMGMQSVWTTEHVWNDSTCGCSFACRNAPEASSSKSKISLAGHDIRKLHV